ncbi:serine hydrolase [Nitrospira sp. KM1]|uniref:serine hydrolase domain-containing protein n=1 Tax=Nitrospira sp. KM1 TaxID=1936990 RepID=UPI0013A7766F|nr:serine hydrolase domain-containing protein [Nitrospira sp. KM1]BCA55663.1 serine hydrolase [Nitrospira sp. KM1]
MRHIQQTLDEWRLQYDIPLVAACIRLDGRLLWSGVSVAARQKAAMGLSCPIRFPIYSITKIFTGICVFRAEAAGLLHVDDPLYSWFPELPVSRKIRLSHLLQHTSGLRDYGCMRAYHEAVTSAPSSPWSDHQFLTVTLSEKPLFEPGTGWSYSNIGYLLLRLILEKATGSSFRRVVDKHIVSTLGLVNTFVAETIDDWHSCMPGYGRELTINNEETDVRSSYHPGWCAPGVAVSTPEDVTRVLDSLFAGDLMDSRSLHRMLHLVHVPRTVPPVVTPSCGLGILADPDGVYGAAYGYGGEGPGYRLCASIVPHTAVGRLSVAAFGNSSGGANMKWAEHALIRTVLAGETGRGSL